MGDSTPVWMWGESASSSSFDDFPIEKTNYGKEYFIRSNPEVAGYRSELSKAIRFQDWELVDHPRCTGEDLLLIRFTDDGLATKEEVNCERWLLINDKWPRPQSMEHSLQKLLPMFYQVVQGNYWTNIIALTCVVAICTWALAIWRQ